MDCSLPGSSIHGIPQARTLEWVAIWGEVRQALIITCGKRTTLGVLGELKEDLDIRHFRPFAKAVTVKIKLENSIIVERAILALDLLVTQFISRPSRVVEEDHLFGPEVI